MGLEEKIPSGFLLTSVEKLAGYMRKNSLWPATFGLACCAIEMMAVGSAAKYDISRFGMEVFRASPRQADLMIVAGRVSNKMAPVLRQIYDQMSAPKWVIAMGACASSGGMFNNYAIVQGVDHIVPVDIYLPGCPPRPEMLMDAILKLHEKIYDEKLGANRAQIIKEVELAAMNAKLKPPTADELRTLKQEHNCESWGEYICDMADNYGISVDMAFQAFDMLGESEAFDGFVTEMEDAEGHDE